MSKAVLISIKSKWCSLIATGKKTVEVRKTIPKLDTPFKCYIYCTKAPIGWFFMNSPDVRRDGKVIGEFVCDKIERFSVTTDDNSTISEKDMVNKSCMTIHELAQYELDAIPKEFTIYKIGVYGWHISDLKIYDRPKDLNEFEGLSKTKFGYEPIEIKRPPQSWRYVEELKESTELLKQASKPIANDVLASAAPEGKEYIEGFTLMPG